MAIKIRGTGAYLPEQVLTNAELAKRVNTSDEWIQQRVGIQERRIASASETTGKMALEAARKALAAAEISPQDIRLIIVATSTADDYMPSTATYVQANLGIPDVIAFDLSAACAGFVYALSVAKELMQNKALKHALVIGSESLSRITDWTDRSTCVLFGDGAGAVVLSADDSQGLFETRLHAAGQYRDLLYAENPLSQQGVTLPEAARGKIKMQGAKVFKHAVEAFETGVREILGAQGLTIDQLDVFIPHQANARIIEAVAEKLGLPMDKVILTLPWQGNTSAATIPLALDWAVQEKRLKRGDLILFEALGAGFVWGSVLTRY